MTTLNLSKDLEAWYNFSTDYWDGQRNQIQDHSGHGRHATASGGPTIGVEGPNDFSATSFDGSDDDFLYYNTGRREYGTIAALVKLDESQDPDTRNYIINLTAGSEPFDERNGLYFYSGRLRLGLGDGSDSIQVAGPGSIPKDEFITVFGWWTPSDAFVTYDGGSLESELHSLGTFDSGTVLIGDYNQNNGNWEGDIAFVGHWNRVLTGAEMDAISNFTGVRRSLL